MANLPGITDLLEAWENYKTLYGALHKKVDEAKEEISRLEEEVVRHYKAANISEEECNHPVTKYLGLGGIRMRLLRQIPLLAPQQYIEGL